MKKLLTFLTLLTLSIGVTWAGEVTFTAGVDKSSTTSITKDGVTISVTSGTFSRDDNYRLYANHTMTIRSSNTISKIVIVCSDISYGPEFLLLNENSTGNLINDSDVTATWTGSSTSVSLNASSQVRMNSIVVTYEGNSGGGDDPTPTNGVKYERVNSLSSGDIGKEFILVNQDGSGALGAISTTNTKYGTVVPNTDFTYNATDHTITVPFDNTSIKVLTLGGESNAWTFDMGNSSYLYWSSGNSLNTTSTLSNNSKWSVSFNDGIASISNNANTSRVIRFNSDRFACYTTNTGSLPCLYRKVESIAETYNVTVIQPAVGGNIATEGNITEAAEGSTVTLIATPDTHYQFTNWNVHKTGDANTTVTVTENQFTMPGYDVTVEATFTAMVAHSITVSDNTGTASPTTAYEGETVTLAPNIPEGQVVDWDNTTVTPQTVTINHSDYTFTMPDADVTVKFAFIVAPNESVATYIFDTTEGLAAIGITAPTSQGVDLSDENSYNSNDVSMTTTHGSTNTRIWYNSSTGLDLRVYGANDTKPAGTLTFAVPNGYTITKIVFNYGDRIGGFTVNTGDITNDNITWTGSAQSVTFTAKDQTRIKTINVTYIPGEVPEAADYYLVGNFDQNWGLFETYKFSKQTDGSYVLDTTLPYVDGNYMRFKIAKVVGEQRSDLGAPGEGYENDWVVYDEVGHNTDIPMNGTQAYKIADQYRAIFTLDPNTMTFNVEKPQLFLRKSTDNWANHEMTSVNGGWTMEDEPFVADAQFHFVDGWHVQRGTNETEGDNLYWINQSATDIQCGLGQNKPNFKIVTAGNYTLTVNTSKSQLTVHCILPTYTASIASGITGGSVSFNADSQVSTLNNLTAGYTVNVYVTPQSSDWELDKLYYTVEGSTDEVAITATDGQYSFQMPAGNVNINATFNWIGGEISETTYELVTKQSDLKVGDKYLIVNETASRAMGISGFSSDVALPITITNHKTTITSDSHVSEFVLGTLNGAFTFFNGDGYLDNSNGTGSGSINQYGEANDNIDWYVTIKDNGNTVTFQNVGTQYYLRYWHISNNYDFRAYTTETNGSSVQLYKVATPPTEATLAEIITLGDEADGKLYKISDADGLLGVYKNGTSVWFTDEKKAVDYQDPMAANYKYYTVVEKDDQGNVLSSTSEKDFRQYNWIEVVFPSETNFINAHVKNLTGTYSCENGNPKLELTVAVDEENDVTPVPSSGLAYEPNPYMAANFVGTQPGTVQGETSTYFFSQPKAQEYAKILWAKWDGEKFIMPTENNAYGFTGSFTIDLQYNITDNPNLVANNSYNFEAIIRKSASKAGPYKVYPTNLQGIPTAINGVEINGQIKSVKYVNVAGMVSDVPFQGVNIVVTEYTDGSRTTSKMLRK